MHTSYYIYDISLHVNFKDFLDPVIPPPVRPSELLIVPALNRQHQTRESIPNQYSAL